MPGDGFAFTVGVGGKINIFAVFRRFFQVADNIFFSLDGLIIRLKIVFNVYADLAFRQIAQMAHAGLHLVAAAQIFSNGLRLCRRLHDNQAFLCHRYLHKFLVYSVSTARSV